MKICVWLFFIYMVIYLYFSGWLLSSDYRSLSWPTDLHHHWCSGRCGGRGGCHHRCCSHQTQEESQSDSRSVNYSNCSNTWTWRSLYECSWLLLSAIWSVMSLLLQRWLALWVAANMTLWRLWWRGGHQKKCYLSRIILSTFSNSHWSDSGCFSFIKWWYLITNLWMFTFFSQMIKNHPNTLWVK